VQPYIPSWLNVRRLGMLAAVLAAFSLITGVSGDLGKLMSVVVGLFTGATSNTGNDAKQLDEIQQEMQAQSQAIAQSSAAIQAQLSTLDHQVFANAMSAILANVDSSGIALAEWHQNQDASQREQALNTSEEGLAAILEEYDNNAYPPEALLPVLGRAVVARLAVLGTFADAPAAADTTQVTKALSDLQMSISTFDGHLVAANQIHTTNSVLWLPAPPPWSPHSPHGQYRYTSQVTYANVTGDKSYNNSVFALGHGVSQQQLAPLLQAASDMQTAGLAEDRERGGVPTFESIAQEVAEALTKLPH
jgi:hypothetical protein